MNVDAVLATIGETEYASALFDGRDRTEGEVEGCDWTRAELRLGNRLLSSWRIFILEVA